MTALMQTISSAEALRRALREGQRRSQLRDEARTLFRTTGERDAYLQAIQEELQDGRYFPVPPRVGSAPHPKDGSRRVEYEQLALREWLVEYAVRDALARLYEPVFAPTSCAYRPGRGEQTLTDLASLAIGAGQTWFACADINQYFSSIDINVLIAELRTFTGDESVALLVRRCIASGGHSALPLGHVLSPFLSNVYLHPIDLVADLQPLLRFADDFFLPRCTHNDAANALAKLDEALQTRGLTINATKRRIVRFPDPASLLKWIPE